MFMFCATAAPTRHPPGAAHSLPAPAPLVTTFMASPRSMIRAVGGSSTTIAHGGERRLRRRSRAPFPTAPSRSHCLAVRDPSHKRRRLKFSSPVSLSPSLQLQPAQPLGISVAQNALGDTRRHATARPVSLNVAIISKCMWLRLAYAPTWAAQPPEVVPLPLSPLVSLSVTPQLQSAQQVWTGVATNALGDTRRHATDFPPPVSISVASHCFCRHATIATKQVPGTDIELCRQKRLPRHNASASSIQHPASRVSFIGEKRNERSLDEAPHFQPEKDLKTAQIRV